MRQRGRWREVIGLAISGFAGCGGEIGSWSLQWRSLREGAKSGDAVFRLVLRLAC